MPLETLDRSPPPFFKQGPSALSRLLVLSALALFLMVADARFHIVQPLRAAIATVLYPAQWLALQPVQWAQTGVSYLTELKTARATEEAARLKLAEQSQRAGQVEQLLQENARLRELLALRDRVQVPSVAAQVLYDATDPYSRRVVVSKGQVQGIEPGSPVMDESGVLGQVTRVYPFVSEITLLIDRDQVIPVMNARTGTRSVAYGDPSPHGGMMELRYMSATEDVKEGDLLTTSGVDGVYPPGLPVARVVSVDRRGDTSFTRIQCQPLAKLQGVTHVMVLAPMQRQTPGGADGTPTAARQKPLAAPPASAPAASAGAAPNRRAARQGARP
ncbi:rod shape-determining protein MreC [Ottowia testudinis]|uniref:Cell shape-determining protein MreC n=1 Tax=Ottowia testudinis TaxID=2816950 RepID=A0A975CF03_9BURK|nr:rod shape-determining protein MreC [Ottowia testudinis]QTD45185.1 rod shape-determining protein MreC [Ottowia testudinis]